MMMVDQVAELMDDNVLDARPRDVNQFWIQKDMSSCRATAPAVLHRPDRQSRLLDALEKGILQPFLKDAAKDSFGLRSKPMVDVTPNKGCVP